MRAWWGVFAAIGLIALGYVGDQLVRAAFVEAARTFSSQWAVALDGVTRVLAVMLMLGLGWLVFSGPRDRLVGLVMLVVGGYFALVPTLGFALLSDTGISLPPFPTESLVSSTKLLLWTGGVVMGLGIVELLWPTARSAIAGATPELSANREQVSSQP